MAGNLLPVTQDSFAGGMFQSVDTQRIPVNGAYDIVNGLVDTDEGEVYRRGGAAFKGTAAPGSLLGIRDAILGGGQRTFLYTSTGLYQLAADDSTPTVLSTSLFTSMVPTPFPIFRTAVVAGMLAIPIGINSYPDVTLFGGSRKTANYSAGGSFATTGGSRAVTGTGTSWLANVDPGMIVHGYEDTFGGIQAVAVVASVESNTALTLATPWPGNKTLTGATIEVATQAAVDATVVFGSSLRVAAASNRLVVSDGSIIRFSRRNNPEAFAATDFHSLPQGTVVTGMQAVRGNLLVFSTAGTYLISNLGLDLTDASGNPQQRLDLLSDNIVLWADAGIAAWQNAAVVPAVDDVYLMDGSSSPVSIGGQIRRMYQAYVAAGYTLGLASVFRGHYVLPVLNGTTWVDTLVFNLASGAWTRLSGQGGSCIGYTARVASSSARQPLLFGINGTRILDCTGWFTPTAANKNEPDGTTHAFSLTTRDYSTSNLRAFFKKARLWVEGVADTGDSPTITAGYAEGIAGSSFTALSGTAGASTGDAPSGVFGVNASGRRIRFQFTSTSPWASLKIKALDVFVRPRGRA